MLYLIPNDNQASGLVAPKPILTFPFTGKSSTHWPHAQNTGSRCASCIDIDNTIAYLVHMQFEWDPQKELANLSKHGVSFKEASEVFEDPLHLSKLDHRFTYFEERWITVGKTGSKRLLVVANLFFDSEGNEIVRIISAREASRNERKQYEEL